MRTLHQLPSAAGSATGVVAGAEGASVAAGVLGVAEGEAESVGVGDDVADEVGLGVAEALALGVAEADADAVGVAESVGSALGDTAPAGVARPESRMPPATTPISEVVTAVPTERLTSHMRSIITRATGGGSNRGNLGESVDSSEGRLLAR